MIWIALALVIVALIVILCWPVKVSDLVMLLSLDRMRKSDKEKEK